MLTKIGFWGAVLFGMSLSLGVFIGELVARLLLFLWACTAPLSYLLCSRLCLRLRRLSPLASPPTTTPKENSPHESRITDQPVRRC